MKVLTWIIENWDNIVVILAMIASVVAIIRKGGKQAVKSMLFALVTYAEEKFGSGTGDLKKSQVITWIYERLPAILKVFISERTLSALIEDALEAAKEIWAKNEAISNYICTAAEAEKTT